MPTAGREGEFISNSKSDYNYSNPHSLPQEEELQVHAELVEKLTAQLGDIEENYEELQKDNSTIKKQASPNDRVSINGLTVDFPLFLLSIITLSSPHQITVIEQELVSSQEEVHEVMQALEELAVSYDSKDREIESVHTERRLLTEENEEIQV